MTGRQGFRRWFAGQVLQKTTELWGTCLHFGTAEPVCRAGTAQKGGIMVYLPSFRGCRAGLRDRYYTERPNYGVPAFFSGLQSRFAGQVLHRKTELWCTCLGDGATGQRGGRAGKMKSGGRAGRAVSPDLLWSASQFGLQCHL